MKELKKKMIIENEKAEHTMSERSVLAKVAAQKNTNATHHPSHVPHTLPSTHYTSRKAL